MLTFDCADGEKYGKKKTAGLSVDDDEDEDEVDEDDDADDDCDDGVFTRQILGPGDVGLVRVRLGSGDQSVICSRWPLWLLRPHVMAPGHHRLPDMWPLI